MSDIFSDDHQENAYETLVGEGKKFKDNEALARSKVEADNHIQNLESTLSELRNELRARSSLEELAEKLAKPEPAGSETPPTQRREPEPEKEKPNPASLAEEVRKLLKEEENQNKAASNLEEVRTGLRERFGADYNNTLTSVAEKLGVSVAFLKSTGQTSPKAFFQLVDSVEKPRNGTPTPPPSSRNPGADLSSGNRKNKAYFDEIRKRDLNEYFSAKVQRELYEEAMRQGKEFFQ